MEGETSLCVLYSLFWVNPRCLNLCADICSIFMWNRMFQNVSTQNPDAG